ncbi:hypothetical protein B0H14DRAFT_3876380 [Mycena olivaceomarginata]|nr:hypothetical protein B0H14DRAFT_3876380 [Mycena olivaceomarginata]
MAGLAVFLHALDYIMATVVACIAGCLLGVYIVINTLPILLIGCPYRTPLTPLLYSFTYGPAREFGIICLAVIIFVLTTPYIFVHNTLRRRNAWFSPVVDPFALPIRFHLPFGWTIRFYPSHDKFMRQAERTYVDRHDNVWTHSALSWLASTTSDPSAKVIVVEALELAADLLAGCSPSQCGRTSTFRWGNNKLVLPPHLALVFVIKHHTVFDQLAVPTWMWLSIYIQTTMRD